MERVLRLIKLYYIKRVLLKMRTTISYVIGITILSIVLLYTMYNHNIILTSSIILGILYSINILLKIVLKMIENVIKELRFNYDKKRQ